VNVTLPLDLKSVGESVAVCSDTTNSVFDDVGIFWGTTPKKSSVVGVRLSVASIKNVPSKPLKAT
jgi:hypothetical protein